MEDHPIRVLLVDDHSVLRDGLRVLLELEEDIHVVGEASNGKEAIEQATSRELDVMVLDLSLPDISGFDVIEVVREQKPELRIIVLSMHIRQEFVVRAMEAGCAGYIPKSSTHESLLDAIRVVQSGESYLHPMAASVLVESLTGGATEKQQFSALTNREQEVLRLTALGFTSREIGEKLTISPKTVETYRQRATEKLDIDSRADLVQFAIKAGILDDGEDTI